MLLMLSFILSLKLCIAISYLSMAASILFNRCTKMANVVN